jgi:hypothetical protein
MRTQADWQLGIAKPSDHQKTGGAAPYFRPELGGSITNSPSIRGSSKRWNRADTGSGETIRQLLVFIELLENMEAIESGFNGFKEEPGFQLLRRHRDKGLSDKLIIG